MDIATLGIKVTSDDVPKAAGELDKLTTAGSRTEQSLLRLHGTTVAGTRNMGAWAAIQTEAAGRSGEHSLAIGRLERSMAGVTERALGLNSTLGLLGATSLKFGVGDIYTVAIVGGIALITTAYEKLTEAARKLREEQEKLIESLSKGNYRESLGPAPDLVQEVQAQRNQWMQDRERRRVLMAYGAKPDADNITRLDRQIAYDKAQLDVGDARLTKARMAASDPLQTVKVSSDFEQKRRKAEEEAQRAIDAFWNGQHRLVEEAMRKVAEFKRIGADYLRDNPASGIVGAAIVADLPKDVLLPHVRVNDALNRGQIKQQQAMGIDLAGEEDLSFEDKMRGHLKKFKPENIAADLAMKGIDFIAAGFLDLASKMFDGGAAAREFALQMKTMKDSFEAAVASFQHNDLVAALKQNAATYDALIKQAWDTLGTVFQLVHDGGSGLKLSLADLAAQKIKNDAIIARQAGYALEDLAVRNMRATGNGAGADLLAFKEAQQREMATAKDTHPLGTASKEQNLADAIYLNNLATTQNSELLAFQNGILSTALRNSPTGWFGVGAYLGIGVTPRGPTDSGPPGLLPGGGPRVNSSAVSYNIASITIDGSKSSKEIVTVLLAKLDQVAASTGGAGSSRSAALDRATS